MSKKNFSDLEININALFSMSCILDDLLENNFDEDQLVKKIDGYRRVLLTQDQYDSFSFAVYHLGNMARELKREFHSIAESAS
jgi:hypothetical protein